PGGSARGKAVRREPLTTIGVAAACVAFLAGCPGERRDAGGAPATGSGAAKASVDKEGGLGPEGALFEDTTARAGIDFRHINGASGQRFILETLGSGSASSISTVTGFRISISSRAAGS